MSQTIIYVHVNIILDFPVTYRNDSVVCQSECTCLHKTVNMVVFFTKKITKYLPKRESNHANVQSCRSNEISLGWGTKIQITIQKVIKYLVS